MAANKNKAIFRGSGLVVLFIIMSVLVAGCDDNNNQNGSLRAVLSVRESPNVPGRMEFDPRGSKPGPGQKLETHTIEVIDTSTGETVYGPVTESAASDSALKKMHFPSGVYLAILTVAASTVIPDGETSVRGPEGKTTDTAEVMFSSNANISFPEAGSCQATCSQSKTNTAHTICALSTKCFMVDLEEDVLSQAQGIDPSINFNTTMWIHAYGGSGGNGTSPDLGGDGGKAGAGGFAQTITSLNALDFPFSPAPTIYYYLGEAGEHDDSGGTGGASTIVTTVEPQSDNSINLSDIVLIAGGGGGGGEGGFPDADGSDGGGGGFAYSTTAGESDTGIGSDASSKGGFPGLGGGGTSCKEKIACKGEGGDMNASGTTSEDGNQGFGGESGGSVDDPGPRGWINSKPSLEDDAGKGGEGFDSSTCDTGGGGGGFGGGGAGGGGQNDSEQACGGGGGGGSYAAASKKTDTDATSTNPKHSGDGEVIIIFNTDSSN